MSVRWLTAFTSALKRVQPSTRFYLAQFLYAVVVVQVLLWILTQRDLHVRRWLRVLWHAAESKQCVIFYWRQVALLALDVEIAGQLINFSIFYCVDRQSLTCKCQRCGLWSELSYTCVCIESLCEALIVVMLIRCHLCRIHLCRKRARISLLLILFLIYLLILLRLGRTSFLLLLVHNHNEGLADAWGWSFVARIWTSYWCCFRIFLSVLWLIMISGGVIRRCDIGAFGSWFVLLDLLEIRCLEVCCCILFELLPSHAHSHLILAGLASLGWSSHRTHAWAQHRATLRQRR